MFRKAMICGHGLLGVAGLQLSRDSRGRLADNGEFLHYGAAQHLRFLKHLEIGSRDELGDVVRSPLRSRRCDSSNISPA